MSRLLGRFFCFSPETTYPLIMIMSVHGASWARVEVVLPSADEQRRKSDAISMRLARQVYIGPWELVYEEQDERRSACGCHRRGCILLQLFYNCLWERGGCGGWGGGGGPQIRRTSWELPRRFNESHCFLDMLLKEDQCILNIFIQMIHLLQPIDSCSSTTELISCCHLGPAQVSQKT